VQLLAASPRAELFNSPALNWLGLITRKPVTEDFVPLLPWLGVVWLGVAVGSWWLGGPPSEKPWQTPAALAVLPLLGRWSLLYYMLHQPIMIGLLWLVRALGT